MSSDIEKIAIIGAGASGLAAAVAQSRMGRRVTLFEHKDRAGIKLALTGNGKCNFSNAFMDPSCFHQTSDSKVGEMLKRFTPKDACDFMKSLGVGLISKSGYYYPDDLKADSVVDALINACEREKVTLCFGVNDIDICELKKNYGKVILACGSRAHKETGSNGTGYKFLEQLGIPYTRVLPALCAMYCEDKEFVNANKGKRVIATVNVETSDRTLHASTGELQITDYGLSGIPAFNISRYVSMILDKGEEAFVNVDFQPDEKDIPEIIKNRANVNAYKPVTGGRFKRLKITKTASFDRSQVCTGGVSLQLLTDDFEVKEVPGIYVIGEMCDVDGICGGYNLHWAWLSANLCAK